MASAGGADDGVEDTEDLGPLPKEWLPDGVLDDALGDDAHVASGSFAGNSAAAMTAAMTGNLSLSSSSPVPHHAAATLAVGLPRHVLGGATGKDLLGRGDTPTQVLLPSLPRPVVRGDFLSLLGTVAW